MTRDTAEILIKSNFSHKIAFMRDFDNIYLHLFAKKRDSMKNLSFFDVVLSHENNSKDKVNLLFFISL